MSVVIDAALLVAAVSDAGPEGHWAESILERHPLTAPHLILVEATNVLRRLELTGHLGKLEATAAARDILLLDIGLVPFEPFADRVWELRQTVTSYDAWYVAVAERFEVPLATIDRKLSQAPGPRCEFLLPESG